MRNVLAVPAALLLFSGGCGSPETLQQTSIVVEAVPTPSVAPQPTVKELVGTVTEKEPLTTEDLQQIFNTRLALIQQEHSDTNTRLRILALNETVECTIKKGEFTFSSQGDKHWVADNCIDDQTIIISEAFIDTHLNSSKDPRNTANLLFAHELGHNAMDSVGIDALTTDKTRGERMADCLAGNSFSTLPPNEKSHMQSVHSEFILAIPEDIAGREAAFASGLAGETCSL